MEVRLLPVKFSKAYNDYQACVAKLLPMNSIRSNNPSRLPGGGIELDAAARARWR
jgi:hypothetical protein